MARTRRVRLYSVDQRWSKGFSAAPRTSQERPARGVARPPFSRTSTGAAAANSRRVASNSAASSTRGIIRHVIHNLYYLEGIIGWKKRKANRSRAPRAAACSTRWECARKKRRTTGVAPGREAGCRNLRPAATRAGQFDSCRRKTPRSLRLPGARARQCYRVRRREWSLLDVRNFPRGSALDSQSESSRHTPVPRGQKADEPLVGRRAMETAAPATSKILPARLQPPRPRPATRS